MPDASTSLHERARALVRAFADGVAAPESFDALAVDLGRFQAEHVPGYLRLCARRHVDPAACTHASQLPAVPTDAFKAMRVAAFPESETHQIFRTSGTTVGQRGRHDFRDLRTYDAAALAFGRASLIGSGAFVVLVLGPSPAEAPDSSLTHMNDLLGRELGAAGSGGFYLTGDTFDLAGLDQAAARAVVAQTPVLLLGTSFAFVHLLEALDDELFPLPPGSRIMQTGGFKGRSREVSATELRRAIATTFAVQTRDVVQEYGMTELSSQFYERTAVDAGAPEGVLFEPPWARVIPVDPDTLAPVAEGEVGIARIEDLCNVDSAFAIQTADRVRRVHGGFELLGRQPGSAPRGCSLAIDELLAREPS